MPFEVLKPFIFSADGVTPQYAKPGDDPDLPTALVAGLVAAGYIRPSAAQAAFNGADPAKFDHDADGAPGGSLTKAEILDDLTRLGIEHGARWSRDRLDALLREGKAAREAAVNASVEG